MRQVNQFLSAIKQCFRIGWESGLKTVSEEGCHIASCGQATGNLKTDRLMIEGEFRGIMNVLELVESMSDSHVMAKIVTNNATLGGNFSGVIKAKGHVRLLSTARVEATIICKSLEIELGAVFNGECHQTSIIGGLLDLSQVDPPLSNNYLNGA